ncbi:MULTISPECIES: DUF992 domain-containing protein [Xanthobacter]|uniref:DUF992 domain-containing protein n=1 Tax=Xanthobacter TaxID=279 RepID=UPI001F42A718|nr:MULTISPECIES: DUF992 domain-containing protein [unclassified Xanthobacter]
MTNFRPALLAAATTLLTATAGVSARAQAPGPALGIAPAQGGAQSGTLTLPQINVTPPAAGSSGSAASTPAPASGGTQMPNVSAGLLECRGEMATATGFGSSRRVRCEFRPGMGQNHYYIGTLVRTGLDIGVSDQGSMLWGVLATSPNLERGALAGTYVGFTSGFSLGPGFSANVLAAQDPAKQVTLQPLSVSSDSGLSLSIAGATLTLEPSTPQVAGDPPPR